jgi:Glyoxalase-like domain
MSSSSSDGSDSLSESSAEEELKLEKLKAAWNVNNPSDEDDSDSSYDARGQSTKMAPPKAEASDSDEESSESEEESEDEDSDGAASESESEYDEVEAVDDEELADESAPTDNEEDNSDVSVVDDGNIEDTLKRKPKKRKQKVKVAPITAPSADDDEEAAKMKELLADWVTDDNDGAASSDSDDDEDDSESSEREVELNDNVIDHIVLAAPNLEDAMAEFEKMTGVGTNVAATIKGLGIKSARISFNDASYIEIIAPDPKEPGPIGNLLKSRNLAELTPFHFAIRSSKAEQLKTEVKKFGYVPDHITMFGAKKDGTPRKWELLYLYGHKLGGICPFFINWSNTDHPCSKLPVVGKLKKFTIRAPKDDPVHALLEHVGVQGINIEVGKPKMSFQFNSPEGTIKFAASKATGFKFPGFESDCGDIGDLENLGSSCEDLDFDDPETPELLEVDIEDYEELPPPAY